MRSLFLFFIGFIALSFSFHSALANASTHTSGHAKLYHQNQENLQHDGMIEIEHSKILKSAIIHGYLKAEHTQFQNLKISGNASLDNDKVLGSFALEGNLDADETVFENDALIRGFIRSENCHFNKELLLYSNRAEFEDSFLTKLIFEKTSDHHIQHLYLENTIITGDVEFKQSGGIIHMDKASTIKGKMIGATIELDE